ncbi:MAG: hypothetical protein FWD68_06780 [Alphaproteobacteria bacterium]|nr:hypothetical protein [Alphaproteobacteria bacterium]
MTALLVHGLRILIGFAAAAAVAAIIMVGVAAVGFYGVSSLYDLKKMLSFTFRFAGLYYWPLFMIVAAAPALILVAVFETLRIRNVLHHALAGAVIAVLGSLMLDPVIWVRTDSAAVAATVLAAGISGGMVYWWMTGRRAGAWRAPRL